MRQTTVQPDVLNQKQFDCFMSDNDFGRLSRFIEKEYGIKLPDSKKTMLEGRLRKRLRHLGMGSFTDYCEYLFSGRGVDDEIVHMVNVVTTNKTDFFREPNHFEFLSRTALPDVISRQESRAGKTFTVWSAGCSSGDEPYTLAIVLTEFFEGLPGPGWKICIEATDISTQVLEKAMRGIYEEEKIAPIPLHLRKKYLLRNKNKDQKLVRIAPELRALIKFRRLNLLDADFGFREKIDIIFCRNVIIYFDRETQGNVLKKMHHCLNPGGFLFLGHSETINGLNLPFNPVAPTVYRKA
jgi:chemotaxis protein methyltransferase CheR